MLEVLEGEEEMGNVADSEVWDRELGHGLSNRGSMAAPFNYYFYKTLKTVTFIFFLNFVLSFFCGCLSLHQSICGCSFVASLRGLWTFSGVWASCICHR